MYPTTVDDPEEGLAYLGVHTSRGNKGRELTNSNTCTAICLTHEYACILVHDVSPEVIQLQTT